MDRRVYFWLEEHIATHYNNTRNLVIQVQQATQHNNYEAFSYSPPHNPSKHSKLGGQHIVTYPGFAAKIRARASYPVDQKSKKKRT